MAMSDVAQAGHSSVPPSPGSTLSAVPLDELELELRRLAGVSYVGFEEEEGALVVQLLAVGATDVGDLRDRAARLSRAHVAGPVIVEVDTGQPSVAAVDERVELLAVILSFDNLEIEVHLAYGGQRTIGRGRADMGAMEVASATLDALRFLRLPASYKVLAASSLSGGVGEAVVVILGSDQPGANRYGIATGKTPEEAAARATLHALNRTLIPRPATER
jgi:inactivated superfamily I helicase